MELVKKAPWIRPGVVVHDTQANVDDLLTGFALDLRARGSRVAGFVQRNNRRVDTPGGGCPNQIELFDLSTGATHGVGRADDGEASAFLDIARSSLRVDDPIPEGRGLKIQVFEKTDVPLQVEHIVPRSRGGTDRVSNLTLACAPCNTQKGNTPVEDFLRRDPDRLAKVLRDAKRPLTDATAVNATRWESFRRLQAAGLPVECGSGGRTKFNRTTRGLPEAHWLDAACVGASTPEHLGVEGVRPLLVKACGHGKRDRCGTDQHGFPIRHAPRAKTFRGFRTGDIVRADIPNGKHRGTHTGRIAIRHRPSFRLGAIDVHPDRLPTVHRADGYNDAFGETFVV